MPGNKTTSHINRMGVVPMRFFMAQKRKIVNADSQKNEEIGREKMSERRR